jgi:hypothetical protein
MTTPSILRLYQEYCTASDKDARLMNGDRRYVARPETEICAQLVNQPGGFLVIGEIEFKLFTVKIGKEQTLQYFKVVVRQEPKVDSGYSFARRENHIVDLVPPILAQRASLRRKVTQ